MKNIIRISFSLISVLLIGFLLVFSQSNDLNRESILNSTETNLISATVKDYWDSAVNGDNNTINSSIVDTPKSFLLPCKEDNSFVSELDTNLNQTYPVGKGEGLSSNFIEQNRTFLVQFSKLIRKNNYTLYKINRITQDKRRSKG